MTKLEKLTLQLQIITYELIELYEILAIYTDKDLQNRLNSFEMLKKEHKQMMLDLQKLPMEISDGVNKVKQLIEENVSYSYLHSQALQDCTQLKENVHVLRLKNRLLWEEQIELQESCEELKRCLMEAYEMIFDPSAEQQQDQEHLDERPKDLLKQKELVTQQEDLADKLQHHFNVSEMSPPKEKKVSKMSLRHRKPDPRITENPDIQQQVAPVKCTTTWREEMYACLIRRKDLQKTSESSLSQLPRNTSLKKKKNVVAQA
ncbi:uncharacterized protein LOC118578093 [Onychomys torridus]|uniref:uncharacterized protein LOC118578093 n=1 Tax=Onychomys torridus TaxID=38674 RepID=UPI00167FA2DC|nr:uncharacterized protein LOC118578093 [Onychomys torridus]